MKPLGENEGEATSAKTRTIERAYREHSRSFLAWARRHAPDIETAEDILQDAFIRTLAKHISKRGVYFLVAGVRMSFLFFLGYL